MATTTTARRGWELLSESRDPLPGTRRATRPHPLRPVGLRPPLGRQWESLSRSDASRPFLHRVVTGVASADLFISAVPRSWVIYSRRKRSGLFAGFQRFIDP